MHRFRFMAALILSLLAAGCAAPTPKVDLKPGTLRPGQTIALVEPPPITHFFMWSFHPGMAFGAIGGAVAGAQFEAQGAEVHKLVSQQGFVGHTEIANAFRQHLERAGYRVEMVTGVWKPDGNLMRLDVARIPASYDRLLVLTPGLLGFYSQGLSGNYSPSLRLRVALYGPDREKPLYDGYHITGLEPKGAGWIVVPPVPTSFGTYPLMIAQPPAMVEALRKGIAAVTQSAVRDMGLASVTAAPAWPAVAASPDVQRLAGAWSGTLKCGEWLGTGTTDNPNPWSQPVKMMVEGANAVMTRGGPEANYEERLEGGIEADLALAVQGRGAMHRTPGSPWFTQASGRFAIDGARPRFEGTATIRNTRGVLLRNCTVALHKAAS